MSKIDYVYKSKVISSDNFKLYQKYCKRLYQIENEFKCDSNGELYSDYGDNKEYHLIKEWLIEFSNKHPKEYRECKRIWNAQRCRISRLKKYIQSMLEQGNCIYLTFTWNEKTYNKSNSTSKAKKVKNFLSSYNTLYVANRDFGKKNHREHYHALILADKVDHTLWTYGNLDFERIRNNGNDLVRLSRYIAKLTNHAIKETTKRSALIYSRYKSN